MPSTRKQAQVILDLIPQNIRGSIAELGSGWGTLALALARHRPQCRITGYESSHVPFLVSKIIAIASRVQNLEFERANFLKMPLQNYSAIVCYLHPAAMHKLQTKLETEMSPGTLVICNTFAMSDWKADHVVELEDMYKTKIYLYRVP